MQKLKIGVIGLGSVVREIYQHLYFNSRYSHLMSIEAACDTNRQAVDEFGERFGIAEDRRFADYRDMVSTIDLDAVAVNTPDSLHKEPVMCALEAGLDVLVAKPLADRTQDAHEMIEKARSCERFMGVDFHKREDPRVKEAGTRFQNGDYGQLQSVVWYMLDKLMVADPNHEPRFFATDDFATRNTPVSFLTVHVADAFMSIVEMKPVEVGASGYKQKLPSLSPIPVDGYDLVDTEVVFENGGVGHFITGWALPNTAHALTVQSARIIGSEGLLDLNIDRSGYHELLEDGIFERNPLFRNCDKRGIVSGYGVDSPGKIIDSIVRFRKGEMTEVELQDARSLFSLGFYTTLICDAAHASLRQGKETHKGVVRGVPIVLKEFAREIGEQ